MTQKPDNPPTLDVKVLEAIRNCQACWGYGYPLEKLEQRFARGSVSVRDVWDALSRLAKSKKIVSSGSHRHKGYRTLKDGKLWPPTPYDWTENEQLKILGAKP